MDISMISEWIREGGWAVYLNLLLGPLGLACALIGMLASKHRVAGLVAGAGAVLVGALAGAVGVVGWLHGRSAVEDAVAFADPATADMLREMGYEEASHALVCGGVAGALPIAAGVLAVVLTRYRGAAAA
jgi:hypothetical protein